MLVELIAVGKKMPAWVNEGVETYLKRLPHELKMGVREIAPARRVKNGDSKRYKEEEGARILDVLPKNAHCVLLDVAGKHYTTERLATRLESWMGMGKPLALVIGGADGVSTECVERADERWSLSSLTLPHPLVRIVVAEQIYRAWSLLNNHPYHRGGGEE
jgi:23S rRNA (pseudouridine1915-N3)-methyltransferase